jgi:RNA-directed DNA polymerase
MEGVSQFIAGKLKLKVNQSKSAVARPKDRKFLSFSFTSGKKAKRDWLGVERVLLKG